MPTLENIDELKRKNYLVGLRKFVKVARTRINETTEQVWRRENAGLEWKHFFLLEESGYFKIPICVYDGAALKSPEFSSKDSRGQTAGYSLGFEIPLWIPSLEEPNILQVNDQNESELKEILSEVMISKIQPEINFNLYCTQLNEQKKDLLQCSSCKLVYVLPREIDISRIRREKYEPARYAGGMRIR